MNLASREGLTVNVGFEKGLVSIAKVDRPKSVIEQLLSPPSIVLFFATVGLGILFLFREWWSKGRDYYYRVKHVFDLNAKDEVMPIGKNETIVVEFEPPEHILPAELGVLVDERADTLDVTATIVDLAAKGYIKITEIPKVWLFGKVDYKLEKLNLERTDLLKYETNLLDSLFQGVKIVLISELKNIFYDELKKVKEKLYEQVVDKNFFAANPEKIRGTYLLFGVIIIIASFIAIQVVVSYQQVFITSFFYGLLVIGVILIVFSRNMPRRTAEGRELYRREKGFELFISRAEKYRQQFFEKKNLFNEVLP
jgi:hypothetical protein